MSNPGSSQPAGSAFPPPDQQYAQYTQYAPPSAFGPQGMPSGPAPHPTQPAYPPGFAPPPVVKKRSLVRDGWPYLVAVVFVLAAVAIVVLVASAGAGSTADDTAAGPPAGAGATTQTTTKANPNDPGCREIRSAWPNLATKIDKDSGDEVAAGLDLDLQQLSALMTDAGKNSSGQFASDMFQVADDADVMRKALDPLATSVPPSDVQSFATDIPRVAADCGIALNSTNDPAILGGS